MSGPTVSGPVRMVAPAKLTLTLRVGARRADGYHDIEALCASLAGLEDIVEVRLTGDRAVTLQVTGRSEGVPTDGSNLAVRAARALLSRVEPGAGARLGLRKTIPPGSGLGGGSSDAAAVLVAVSALFPEEAAGLDLEAIGAGLGSDVPFCVRGGLAWMRGRGEMLESVGAPPPCSFVVAVPPFPCPTAEVYEAWDALGGPAAPRRVPAPAALGGLIEVLANDLEPAAVVVTPGLARFRDRFADICGRPPIMAGSGSAWFTVWDASEAAAASEAALAMAREATVALPCAPSTRGVRPLDG